MNLPVADASVLLMQLEIEGFVIVSGGQYIAKIHPTSP
jgi:hypothetical protein